MGLIGGISTTTSPGVLKLRRLEALEAGSEPWPALEESREGPYNTEQKVGCY